MRALRGSRSALLGRAGVALVIGCAALAPLAVHWIAGRTVVSFDTQILFAPQRWIVEEALLAFRLPLWNPYMGAGMPLLADAIHGVLHPVSVAAAWLRTGRSMDVMIGGYVACAGLGAALLARDFGASRVAAAAAGFTYAGSGYVLSMSGNLVFLAGAGSLPLCVAGLRRVAVTPAPGNVALGIGGTAILALSGDAQAVLVAGGLSLALAVEAGRVRGALRAAAAGGVGLLVAGVQLVPSAVNISRSARAPGTWVRAPGVWALEPWRFPELVLPGWFLGEDPLVDRVFEALAGPGSWPAGGLPHPFATSVFVGLVPVVLAIVGAREGRRGRILAGAALVLLWAALGETLGAEAILGRVPLWESFRYSEKLVGPFTLAVAMLAALGVDAVIQGKLRPALPIVVASALAVAALGGALVASSRVPAEVAPVARARMVGAAWHLLGAGLALAALVVARERLPRRALGVGLAALVWCGSAAASAAAIRAGDPDSRLRWPVPALDAAAPGARIVTPYTHDPLSTQAGLDWLDQSGRLHASLGYAAYNVRGRLDSLTPYNAMLPRRLAAVEEAYGVRWARAARRFAVTHVVLDRPLNAQNAPLYAAATAGGTRIGSGSSPAEVWAVPHREWASFPVEVRAVPDVRSAIGALASGSEAAVVESRRAFPAGPGRVIEVTRGLERLRVEAETAAESTLVVADAWWPGWEATMDGVPTTIYPADALVRAVRWPAGRHVLEMRYRPPEVRTGLAASVAGVVLALAWIAFGRRLVRGPAFAPTAPASRPPDP